jgi:hypothetical protein
MFLYQGQIFLQGLLELSFHQLPHGTAFQKDGRMGKFIEFGS